MTGEHLFALTRPVSHVPVRGTDVTGRLSPGHSWSRIGLGFRVMGLLLIGRDVAASVWRRLRGAPTPRLRLSLEGLMHMTVWG